MFLIQNVVYLLFFRHHFFIHTLFEFAFHTTNFLIFLVFVLSVESIFKYYIFILAIIIFKELQLQLR